MYTIKNIFLSYVLLFFMIIGYSQKDTNIRAKKYLIVVGLETRIMMKNKNYVIRMPNKTDPWGTVPDTMFLKNTFLPFFNFNINHYLLNHWIVGMGMKIGEIVYGKIIENNKKQNISQCVLNLNASIGYSIKLFKIHLYSRLNIENQLFPIWSNKNAGYLGSYKDFSEPFNPVYLTGEFMLNIPMKSKYFILPKIELFLINITKQTKLFEYKNGNYYFINLGINYGF